MKKDKRKTAAELITTHPGVFERHQAIVLAICESYFSLANAVFTNTDAKQAGKLIVLIANSIIEETEQL